MAELLVRAQKPDNDIQEIGDVVAVRLDGWKWGTCECLPEYLVVKLEGKVEDLKYLEQTHTFDGIKDLENEGKWLTKPFMIKRRKYQIPPFFVNSKAPLGETLIVVEPHNTKSFTDSIVDKSV